MQRNLRTYIFVAVSLLATACGKKPDDFKTYLNEKEVIYPGTVSKLKARPGNTRVQLNWSPSPDPSVSKYTIYWNNGTDSLSVNNIKGRPTDTVKCLIENLKEYTYTFTFVSFDAAGNKSIRKELNNVKVFGPIYQAGLSNRSLNTAKPGELKGPSSLTLYFAQPDTINITTRIRYTNVDGIEQVKLLPPDSTSVTIGNYLKGTKIFYRSDYIPVRSSVDTFQVMKSDSLPGFN